ncbi:hypothetical protein Bbelb_133610 [Branchiostoma belcheri]|nr:hypothetical protein Bbelb_133610 [Branchiostoma belcheri]
MQSGMYSRRSTTGRTAREPSSTRSNAATRGIQERETQLRKISEQYDKAKDELKRKSNECKDVKRELKETKEQLRRKEKENEILEKRIDQKEKEIKQFKGVSGQRTQRQAFEFAQKMDQKKELEKRNEDVRQLRIQLIKKDNEIARALEKANEKLRQSEEKGAKEEKRNALLIQNLYGELSAKDEYLRRMQDALRQKESKLDEMRTYLEKNENKQLRTQAKDLESRNNEARRALEDQSALNKKIHDLEKELEGLEKEHNRVSRAHAMPREQIELKNVRTENQKLQTQVKGLEARNKEATHAMENEKSVLKNELVTKNQHITSLEIGARELLKRKERDQKMLETLGKENQQLRTQVDSLQAEKHSLLHQYTEAKSAAESFRHRLSKEFGIRLNSNETNMENISVKNRPAKVAEKFAEIESKEWVVAKEVFDDRFDDERTNIKFLLDLFKFACKRAQEIFNGFLTAEVDRLLCPIATVTCTRPTAQHVGGTTGVPESLRHEITAFLKETCGGLAGKGSGNSPIPLDGALVALSLRPEIDQGAHDDLSVLPWRSLRALKERAKEGNGDDIAQILQNSKVISFVEACSRLAWQMAVQQPPLTAVTPDTEYDDRSSRNHGTCGTGGKSGKYTETGHGKGSALTISTTSTTSTTRRKRALSFPWPHTRPMNFVMRSCSYVPSTARSDACLPGCVRPGTVYPRAITRDFVMAYMNAAPHSS